jgi:hypothetical protein
MRFRPKSIAATSRKGLDRPVLRATGAAIKRFVDERALWRTRLRKME